MKRGFFFKLVLSVLIFGLSVMGCPNETTPESDTPTRWLSITRLDKIGLSSFKFSVLLSDTDNKGVTEGLIYELRVDDELLEDFVLTGPLISSIEETKNGFEYKYWHGSGDYYVNFIIITIEENKVYQKWKSDEQIHFSDDSPDPVLSLENAHLE